MIVNEIKDFLKNCPYLKDDKIALKAGNFVTYVIVVNASEPIIEEYLDGTCLRQLDFSLNSVDILSEEDAYNLQTNEIFQNLAKWLKTKTLNNELPENWNEIRATDSGFISDNEETIDKVIYQINIELQYFSKE